MKILTSLGLMAVLAAASQAGQAAEAPSTGCTSLECMVCPALSDPQKYAEGRMKLMREIVPGKDRWLFRSAVDLTNDFGIPAPMRPEFARLMAAFRQQGIHVAMAVQPTRGLMHRDKLYPGQLHGFDFERASNNLASYLQQLRSGGAVVPDLMQLVRTRRRASTSFAATTTGPQRCRGHRTPGGR
ncbi:hypothetical protein NWF32_21655 [Pseudomonas qingdaonensis]|nr:hypothetical protein [Pseudomonas qingdaonensis]